MKRKTEYAMPRSIQKEIREFYDVLEQELDRFSCGQQFYSIRELIERHRVSRRTVEKTLARLEAEGQIAVEPAKGIYVSRNRDKTVRTVTSVHCDWPAEYWQNLDAEIEAEVQRHPGWRFSRALFEPNSGSDYLRCLNTLHGDVILFTFPIHRFRSSEIAAILSADVPIVFLENNLLCDGVNVVDSQPEYAGMMAAECLIRNGHRELALILSEPWSMGDGRRNAGFLNYARLHGIEPHIIDCSVQGGEASSAKVHDVLLDNFRRNGPAFTGCFTMSDYSALGVISAIKEYGLSVPGDVSVIGVSGIASGAHFDPPLTTVACDMKRIAAVIGEGLSSLFSGGTFGVRTVSPVLIERKSVKNLQKGN